MAGGDGSLRPTATPDDSGEVEGDNGTPAFCSMGSFTSISFRGDGFCESPLRSMAADGFGGVHSSGMVGSQNGSSNTFRSMFSLFSVEPP
mmetsp:Transcript_20065/g.42848  ORF Transcript_20065/g.42848 Transcript_20065/m.42848 type:complete len:90 (-) Transcript_20065:490-759(-)